MKSQKQIWAVDHTTFPQSLTVLPDETAVVTAMHGWLPVYSVNTGKTLWQAGPPRGWFFQAVWTADSKYLVTGDAVGIVSVWDGATGKELRNAQISGSQVRSLGWIEPGKTLFASSQVCAAYAVDFATLRRVGGALLSDAKGREVVVSADGHYRGPEGADEELVYVAELADGRQELFTPKEFAARFGWKNDPSKANLDWVAERRK